jgi:hypothetical protein
MLVDYITKHFCVYNPFKYPPVASPWTHRSSQLAIHLSQNKLFRAHNPNANRGFRLVKFLLPDQPCIEKLQKL